MSLPPAIAPAGPPIVITGVHRSGTTLIAESLRRLGVFLGARRDPNGEAYFFLRLNEWVMRRAGGAWDYPLPTAAFLQQEHFFQDSLRILEEQLRSFRFAAFTGFLAYLFSGRRPDSAWAWGWKDPRTIFTFPLWARLFPDLRLIYVVRNGVDVASSLAVREHRRREKGAPGLDSLRIRPLPGRLRDAVPGLESFAAYLFTTRCTSLEESFRLWEEYAAEGERLLEGFAGPRLVVRYEDFLARPAPALERLAAFCNLAATPEMIGGLAESVLSGRSCAFLGNPELCRFYDTVKNTPLMQRLGYSGLDRA